MEVISELPAPGDMDADYSPQYVKLARIIRGKIKAGEYKHGDHLTAAGLISDHKVSKPVALAALGMLAANGYVARTGGSGSYRVAGDGGHGHSEARR